MPQDTTPVLAELRAALELRRHELAPPTVQLERSWTELELERSLETVEAFRVVSSHWPLTWHNLPTRFWSGVNRLVRRYLRWYIDPLVSQQNAFNSAVAQLLVALKAAQDDLRRQRAELASSPVPEPLSRDLAHHSPHSPYLAEIGDESFAALSALIAARAALEPPATFPELELLPLLRMAESKAEVQAHWELSGSNTYERGLIIIHKLVRRYLRWLVNPLVAQQNAHNVAVCRALAVLIALDAELRAEMACP